MILELKCYSNGKCVIVRGGSESLLYQLGQKNWKSFLIGNLENWKDQHFQRNVNKTLKKLFTL